MKVLIPTIVYVVMINFIGLYIASMIFIAFFMWWLGKYSPLIIAPVAIGVPAVLFVMFEIWFLVPCLRARWRPRSDTDRPPPHRRRWRRHRQTTEPGVAFDSAAPRHRVKILKNITRTPRDQRPAIWGGTQWKRSHLSLEALASSATR